jgi:hypothetical protein
VKYHGVYEGVDLVYYGNQGKLEYDFVVAPGTDPKSIQLAFSGVDRIRADNSGDLILQTASGDLRMHTPLVYQEITGVRKEISAAYILNGNPKSKIENPKSRTVGFQVASYDVSKPLVIDPVLSYSTYLGGSGDEPDAAISLDSNGNIYVAGETVSLDFPTVNPAQPVLRPASDTFVTKLDPSGSTLLYSTYIGGNGTGGDPVTGIAVDSVGSAYVTGSTDSSDFPTVNPVQSVLRGQTDAFVTKLSPTGSPP